MQLDIGGLGNCHSSVSISNTDLQKNNINADTLSHIPLDIDNYMGTCTEELSQDMLHATWDRGRVAQKKDVAWMAALYTSSANTTASFTFV